MQKNYAKNLVCALINTTHAKLDKFTMKNTWIETAKFCHKIYLNKNL